MSELKEMPLVQLSAKDLPAFCPNPNMPRWSTHPRVFLDITHGEARCPYCGTRYKLKDGETVEYEQIEGEKGLLAKNVKRVAAPAKS